MSKGEQALKCLMDLNQLDENGYTNIIKNDVGPEILGVFEKYCQGISPQTTPEILNTLMHLMITGYLVKAREGNSASGPSKIIMPK